LSWKGTLSKKKAKAPFSAICNEVAAAHAETPFVIVGDLNTGNQLVDKSAGGARLSLSEIKSEHTDGVIRRELVLQECAQLPEQPVAPVHP
jgi:hypothetical protein